MKRHPDNLPPRTCPLSCADGKAWARRRTPAPGAPPDVLLCPPEGCEIVDPGPGAQGWLFEAAAKGTS